MGTRTDDPRDGSDPEIGPPARGDGARIRRLAERAGGLDVNSTYAYVLWVRDFAATTAVARHGDRLAAYCTGYLRPDAPDTYFVWQVAVDPDFRQRGLARALLDELVARTGARAPEATVTPGNAASRRLFTAFAEAHGATLHTEELFGAQDLGDGHEPEDLFRIEPL
jgi:L-2,4-diaminobutyric acid acetyltransferase